MDNGLAVTWHCHIVHPMHHHDAAVLSMMCESSCSLEVINLPAAELCPNGCSGPGNVDVV